jgi:hypothetical protein
LILWLILPVELVPSNFDISTNFSALFEPPIFNTRAVVEGLLNDMSVVAVEYPSSMYREVADRLHVTKVGFVPLPVSSLTAWLLPSTPF